MPSKAYYHERRKRFYAAFDKLGGCCKSCGSKESLQFDHIDEMSKRYNISEMHYHSDRLFYQELEKCQLLCETCHSKKTGKFLSEVFVGEDNPASKLTEENVKYIRENYKARDRVFGARALSRKFGIAHTTLLSMLKGDTWK